MNCQHCQTLLLDHLYGLLDSAEAVSVDAHLANCPACAASLTASARMQGLIARAAKSAFPGTKFEPPLAQPSRGRSHTRTREKARVLAYPSRSGSSSGRTRIVAAVIPWVVAAAVLIAIPGTVLPVMKMYDRAAKASGEAEIAMRDAAMAERTASRVKADRDRTLSNAEFAYVAAEQAQQNLIAKWVEEGTAAVQNATSRRLTVDVLKPQTIQPGAPNDFILVVNDLRQPWETTGKRMVAEIHAVDVSDAVIYTQPINTERTAERKHSLRLPASAWTKVNPHADLYLVVAQVDEKTQTRTELQDRVKLAGPVYTTLLVTDKSAYRPGERLFFRSLTLDRITLRPPTREQFLKYELLHPNGTPVTGMNLVGTTELVRVDTNGAVEPIRSGGQPVRGVGSGEFVLPPDLQDGDYILRLTEGLHPGGFPATIPVPITRSVKIRSGTTETHRKEIGFARASYVPGDQVEAWAELKFNDTPVAGAAVVSVAVEADSQPLGGIEFPKETEKDGRARIRFDLPQELLNGDVRLKVTFRTQHGEETVAARVPVIGNRVIIEFFPESGDSIIAGVPCKVYVRATTPSGQPVDFSGTITDGRQTLAKVEPLNDRDHPGANRGLACFTYTPELGTRAWLKLESPSTVYAPILEGVPVQHASVAIMGGPGATALRTGFMLPRAKTDGVVMSVLDPITSPGEPIRVQLHSVGQPRVLVVGAYTRGRLSDTQKVSVEPGVPQTIKLMAGSDPRGGVVRITAFEEINEAEDLKPVAERLVFRKPGEFLNLSYSVANAGGGAAPPATPNAPEFSAGSLLNLTITATDEKGNPVAAIIWAAAVNQNVAPGVKDRSLPTHFLLAGEVKNPDDLEYADFLLTNHEKAGPAIDLLLGTQGWRRFAEQSSVPPTGANKQPYVVNAIPPDIARYRIQQGQYSTWTEHPMQRDHRELTQKYEARTKAAAEAVKQAEAALKAAREAANDTAPIEKAGTAAASARQAAEEKVVHAEATRKPVQKFRANVWYGVAGLAALALCCGLGTFLRPAGRFPLGFSTLGSVGLAGFLVIASSWKDDSRAHAMSDKQSEDKLTARLPMNITVETPRPAADKLPGPGAGPKINIDIDKAAPEAPPALVPGAPSTMPIRDARSMFVPYPPLPQSLIISRGTLETKGGFMGGGQGLGSPLAPSLPGGTVRPIDPKVGVLPPDMALPPRGAGDGWDPHRVGGVSAADIKMSNLPQLRNMPAPALQRQSDELKQANERANAYAVEQSNALAIPLESFLKRGVPEIHAVEAPVPPAGVIAFNRVRVSMTTMPPLVVREYAMPRPGRPPEPDEVESPDTVLWQPIIVLPEDGKISLDFHIGNAKGGYELIISGHTMDGRLGVARGQIRVAPQQTLIPDRAPPPVVPGNPVVPDARPIP